MFPGAHCSGSTCAVAATGHAYARRLHTHPQGAWRLVSDCIACTKVNVHLLIKHVAAAAGVLRLVPEALGRPRGQEAGGGGRQLPCRVRFRFGCRFKGLAGPADVTARAVRSQLVLWTSSESR